MKSPIVIIFTLILLVITLVYSVGCSIDLPNSGRSNFNSLAIFMTYGIQNTFYELSFMFAIFSMSLGVFTIIDERSSGSLRVLMCKPVYRRDIILGKLIGDCEILIITITFILGLLTSLIMLFYPLPLTAFPEISIRIITYIIFLFLMCTMTLLTIILIGSIVKNVTFSIVLSITLIYLQWFNPILSIFDNLIVIFPKYLYLDSIADFASGRNIFNISMPYSTWFSSSLPYIVFMILEILLLTLMTLSMFNREES